MEEIKGRSRHVELTIDQLVELQPGLGRLMPEVARRYWILYYAARGGNWALAAHQLRQIRHLFVLGGMTRPKMGPHLETFAQNTLDGIEKSLKAQDWPTFDRSYREGIESANRLHVLLHHPEIRWRLPSTPPEDLELGGAGE